MRYSVTRYTPDGCSVRSVRYSNGEAIRTLEFTVASNTFTALGTLTFFTLKPSDHLGELQENLCPVIFYLRS